MANAVEVAKEIRKGLKEMFPMTKFSVRSSNYSMGSSVSVSWTDFPTSSMVNEYLKQFQQVRYCEASGEILSGGNFFVNGKNTWTPETRTTIETRMAEKYSEEILQDWVWNNKAFTECANELYNELYNTAPTVEESNEEQHEASDNVTASFTLNDEHNGIEISFNGKPAQETIDQLKVNGFRWHRFKKVWYAKQSSDRLTFAESLCKAEEKEEVEAITPNNEKYDQLNATIDALADVLTEEIFKHGYSTMPTNPEPQTTIVDGLRDYITSNNITITEELIKQCNTLQYTKLAELLIKCTETPTETATESEQHEPIIINGKITVKSITFLWSESSHIPDGLTVSTFTEVNEIIRKAAVNAPDDGCYDKTKFLITFTDGYEYVGRMDIVKNDMHGNGITDHVTSHCEYYAGIKHPSHMTKEQWDNHVADSKQDYTDFLDKYALTDMQTDPEPTKQDNSTNVLDFATFKRKADNTNNSQTTNTLTAEQEFKRLILLEMFGEEHYNEGIEAFGNVDELFKTMAELAITIRDTKSQQK